MNVKDKIKKLLSLATSPNENEARAALLKAKKLMMEHKMSEKDIVEDDDRELVHVTNENVRWTSDSGDIWMVELSRIIGENYMCVTAWNHTKGHRTYTLCVIGIGEDPEVCSRAIEFAVGVIKNSSRDLHRKYGGNAKNTRHSYASGFILGLEVAFKNQREEHQEWGLVEVKHEDVKKYEDGLGYREVNARVSEESDYMARLQGYSDGTKFNARAVLE